MESNHYFIDDPDNPRECFACLMDISDHPEPGDLEPTDFTPDPSDEFAFARFEMGE